MSLKRRLLVKVKKVITAIGDKELNNVLQEVSGIKIVNSDIQYQEGILEVLDKYKNIDILILSDKIIGNVEIEELIRNIKVLQEKIQIILISSIEITADVNRYIAKIVYNNHNYVKEILEYMLDKEDIKQENATTYEEECLTQISTSDEILENQRKEATDENKRYKRKQKIENHNVVTVIGNAGVRKDNFYFYTC